MRFRRLAIASATLVLLAAGVLWAFGQQKTVNSTSVVPASDSPAFPTAPATSALGQKTTANSQSIVPASDSPAFPVTGAPTSGTTSANFGTATAPALGGAVVTITAPGAGKYQIAVRTGFGATVAAGDSNNMELRVGGTVISRVITPAVANSAPAEAVFPRVDVPAATNVSVNATAAGTAGAIYNANLIIQPVN